MDDDATRPRFAEISTAFPTVPESVAAARRFVAVSLRRFDFSHEAIERAALVTSELVAHAFEAGRPPIRIRVRSIADGRALVEVTHGVEDEPADEGAAAERLQLTPAGRAVVESMSARWGIRPSGAGVMAWFEADDGRGASTEPSSTVSGHA
jgi:anti-sigma regulatory factor (Ser/Thr protein kinase)